MQFCYLALEQVSLCVACALLPWQMAFCKQALKTVKNFAFESRNLPEAGWIEGIKVS